MSDSDEGRKCIISIPYKGEHICIFKKWGTAVQCIDDNSHTITVVFAECIDTGEILEADPTSVKFVTD